METFSKRKAREREREKERERERERVCVCVSHKRARGHTRVRHEFTRMHVPARADRHRDQI